MKKSERAMVKANKAAYLAVRGKEYPLSDELVLGIIDRAGDAWDDMSDEAKLDLFDKCLATANDVSVSDIGISALAAKLDRDKTTVEEMKAGIEAALRGKLNTVIIYADWKRLFTKDELDAMPYPGTDKDTVWLGNFKPDTVKTQAVNGEEITTVWTNDFADKTELGKSFNAPLDEIKKELAQANSSTMYKGWGKSELDAERSIWEAKRNAYRGMIRRTIELHHMFEGVLGMPKVSIKWCVSRGSEHIAMPEKFGHGSPVIKVTRAPKNLWLSPSDAPELGRTVSVSQLLQFELATAIKNGGTMADLTNTAKKAPKKTGTDATGDGSAMTIAEAYANTAKTCNYFGERVNVAEIGKILADPKHSDHKDWVQMVGGLWSSIYPLAKRIRAEYEKENETKMEGLDRAAQG